MTSSRTLFCALASTLLCAACGGGSGDANAATGSGNAPSSSPEPASTTIAITPMTTVDTLSKTGYFVDPYPVHRAASNASAVQTFSGTSKAVLHCAYPVSAHCFDATPVTVDSSVITAQIVAAGSRQTNIQNLDIFQDAAGQWQMTLAIGLKNPAFPAFNHWTLIAHAHPVGTTDSNGVPTGWAADSVLVGSVATARSANYDPKYFEDAGKLYLIYVRRVSENPARNAVVAQLMTSPTQTAPDDPTVLLAVDDADGGFNSEFFDRSKPGSRFKLVEVGNVTVVNGKYAMAYSAGAFFLNAYKSGVAWSDTFLPAPGATYRKVVQQDAAGIWGQPNHTEVRYLLQSEQKNWPNYVGDQVVGPGVPSIVQGTGGAWYLYFGAYDPGDLHYKQPNMLDGSFRRPYFARLKVAVPTTGSVAATSDADLAGWLTPMTR